MILHPNRATTRSAAPMRLAEGLVEVVVDSIEAHPSGIGLADDGIEVRAVVVHLPA